MVSSLEHEYLGISYGNIVGLLVEAIKDSDIEVDKLKSQNASLTGEVASLTGEVASLTTRYDTEISTLKSQVQLLLSKLSI